MLAVIVSTTAPFESVITTSTVVASFVSVSKTTVPVISGVTSFVFAVKSVISTFAVVTSISKIGVVCVSVFPAASWDVTTNWYSPSANSVLGVALHVPSGFIVASILSIGVAPLFGTPFVSKSLGAYTSTVTLVASEATVPVISGVWSFVSLKLSTLTLGEVISTFTRVVAESPLSLPASSVTWVAISCVPTSNSSTSISTLKGELSFPLTVYVPIIVSGFVLTSTIFTTSPIDKPVISIVTVGVWSFVLLFTSGLIAMGAVLSVVITIVCVVPSFPAASVNPTFIVVSASGSNVIAGLTTTPSITPTVTSTVAGAASNSACVRTWFPITSPFESVISTTSPSSNVDPVGIATLIVGVVFWVLVSVIPTGISVGACVSVSMAEEGTAVLLFPTGSVIITLTWTSPFTSGLKLPPGIVIITS